MAQIDLQEKYKDEPVEDTFVGNYKHDPAGEVNNYAYEVMGVGHHTEEEGVYMVVYRPLYEAFVYVNGKMFDIRPLEMFMEKVEKDGVVQDRFTKITDPDTIQKLSEIAERMY